MADEPKDTRTPEQIAEDERRTKKAEELRKKNAATSGQPATRESGARRTR
jgi:hypothetical protein